MRPIVTILVAVVPLSLPAAAFAQQPTPVGDDFQVNTATSGWQFRPRIGSNATGDRVVVWESDESLGTDTDQQSVQAQRFDRLGSPIGVEFQVNSFTTSDQKVPAVAVGNDGSFVVVWNSDGSFGTDNDWYSVQARRFDAAGAAIGLEVQVNTYTTNAQRTADVAIDSDGAFIVVWQSRGSFGTDTSIYSIQGQRFGADGRPDGANFQINSYTTAEQQHPRADFLDDGEFVVVWQSRGSSGDDDEGYSIQGQLFNEMGLPVGSEFQVNTLTAGYQNLPSLATRNDGHFSVVWESPSSPAGGYAIQAQQFDALGLPTGAEFQVNSSTTELQYCPDVAYLPGGDFVVVWDRAVYEAGPGYYSYNPEIVYRQFEADGTPVTGDEFQINTFTEGYQTSAAVASSAAGDFLVVWHSESSPGTDTDGFSVQGRGFETPIFADGFESGDTTAWSAEVP